MSGTCNSMGFYLKNLKILKIFLLKSTKALIFWCTTILVLCKWLHCDLWSFPQVRDFLVIFLNVMLYTQRKLSHNSEPFLLTPESHKDGKEHCAVVVEHSRVLRVPTRGIELPVTALIVTQWAHRDVQWCITDFLAVNTYTMVSHLILSIHFLLARYKYVLT